MYTLIEQFNTNNIMGPLSFGGGSDSDSGSGSDSGSVWDTAQHVGSQVAQGTLDNGGRPFPPNCFNSGGCHGPDNYDPYGD